MVLLNQATLLLLIKDLVSIADTDVVLSKGRQENGSPVYNSTFGLSYFDPQFFTKILLDERITVVGSFTPGQYVYGIESGAYGVVEGSATGTFTTTKTLMVKTLFGNFKSGKQLEMNLTTH